MTGPELDELDEHAQHADVAFVYLHCLLDDYPEVGRGFHIARGHGAADLNDEGAWVVSDLSRLERD